MLLNELHGYKQYLGKSLRGVFVDLCEKHGIRVASGGFGFVIKSSKPYVYKVWSKDEAWEDWLTWAKANPSKYIIKQLGPVRDLPFEFGSISAGEDAEQGNKNRAKKAAGKTVKLKYVKLEKLSPLRDGTLADAIMIACKIVPNMVSRDTRYTVEELAHKIADVSHLIEDDILLNEKFFEAYLDVARAVGKMGHTTDLHDENVMMRDMTPVITDPAKTEISWDSFSAPDLVNLFDTKIDKA